ncbi:MAG: hypothetical protein H6765_11125 [Candidatus Peribacteria bacterium]|nr:MAG: hypothetical protein H6765_11125 [Candidatus Peribacteria bacterium]
MSPEHAQDYMQMEVYWSYANYEEMMQLTKDLYLHIMDTTYGKRQFHIRGFDVDFDAEWTMIDYTTVIREKTGVDIFAATDGEIEIALQKL